MIGRLICLNQKQHLSLSNSKLDFFFTIFFSQGVLSLFLQYFHECDSSFCFFWRWAGFPTFSITEIWPLDLTTFSLKLTFLQLIISGLWNYKLNPLEISCTVKKKSCFLNSIKYFTVYRFILHILFFILNYICLH